VSGTAEVAVGGIAVRDGAILLVRRGRPPGAGEWSVPGGRVRYGEELHEAVVREVAEETGLEVVVDRFAGWVERIGSEPAPYHFVILDFYVSPLDAAQEPKPGDDAVEVAWVPLDGLDGVRLVDGLLDFLVDHDIVDPAHPVDLGFRPGE
jgi:8-oxo-dGTP diphosphatase